jgi:hypothetical protein
MEKSKNEEIDISWLEEMKIPDPPVIFYKESMKTVDIYFIYVTKSANIDKIERETYILEQSSKSILKKEILLKAVQQKRNPSPRLKYKLNEILVYTANIEPGDIPEYVKTENPDLDKNIRKVGIEDIEFPSCLPIFNRVNSCFIFLEETILVNPRKDPPIKSILKKENSTNKKTKKVRISPDSYFRDTNNKTEKRRIYDEELT